MGPARRRITWVKRARKTFDTFPQPVQEEILQALGVAAQGRLASTAKPLKGLGSGVFEIAVRHAGNAYRAVYAVHIGSEIWVLHVFQKKSKTGISTPKEEIDVVKARVKQLKESK
jgi:phage-related protein